MQATEFIDRFKKSGINLKGALRDKGLNIDMPSTFADGTSFNDFKIETAKGNIQENPKKSAELLSKI